MIAYFKCKPETVSQSEILVCHKSTVAAIVNLQILFFFLFIFSEILAFLLLF